MSLIGLDDFINSYSDGAAAWIAVLVAVLLGLGHATTLFAFGIPILVLDRYLSERVQQLAESAIAVAIGYLALRLIIRWRRGLFHVHAHEHDGVRRAHLHAHAEDTEHGHPHRARTKLGSFAIGLVHGMGGSALHPLATARFAGLSSSAIPMPTTAVRTRCERTGVG